MLLTTEWHPWFSYEWWADIGTPAFGALGSIAVGAGALVVALRSSRFAEAVAAHERQSKASEKAAADQDARGQFALLATEWIDREYYERTSGPGNLMLTRGRNAQSFRTELDVKAAALGQRSKDLIAVVASRVEKQGVTADPLEQRIADVLREATKRDLRLWVESPDLWERLDEERRARETERANEAPEEPFEP